MESDNLKPCPTCGNGRMRVHRGDPCPTCNGTGTVPVDKPENLEQRLKRTAKPYNFNQPSQPDPAGQMFEDYVWSEIVQFRAELRHGFNQAATGKTATQLATESITTRHNADREAYARQEVVKALEELKQTSNYVKAMPAFDDYEGHEAEYYIYAEDLNSMIEAYKDGK